MQELSFLAEKAPPSLSNLGGMLRSLEIDHHLCMLWFGLVPRFKVAAWHAYMGIKQAYDDVIYG